MNNPEQVYLDLKSLAPRTGISIRKWRDFIKDPVNPVPHYVVGGKILVFWPEVHAWLQQFRSQTEITDVVNEVLNSLK
jgi:hypothetical protein